MSSLATHFLLLLAYNVAFSVLAFVIVYFLRRKERELTPLRGTAAALASWVLGSVLVIAVHLLFALGGTEVGGGQLEMPISLFVLIPVTYFVFGWLSKKRSGVVRGA